MEHSNLYVSDRYVQNASQSSSTSSTKRSSPDENDRKVIDGIDTPSPVIQYPASSEEEIQTLVGDIRNFLHPDQQVAYSIKVELGHRQQPVHAVGDAALAVAAAMYTLQLIGARCGGYYVLQHVSVRGPGHGLYTPTMSCLVIARDKARAPSRLLTTARIQRALARDLGPDDVSILVREFELSETAIRHQVSVMYASYTFPDGESELVQRALDQRTFINETWAETIGNSRSRVFVLASLPGG